MARPYDICLSAISTWGGTRASGANGGVQDIAEAITQQLEARHRPWDAGADSGRDDEREAGFQRLLQQGKGQAKARRMLDREVT